MKIAIASLIIALSVAILSLFQFEKYQILNTRVERVLAKARDTQKTTLDLDIEKNLATFKESENNKFMLMDQKLQALNETVNKLNTVQETKTIPIWQATEAYHFIKLANLRLQTTEDITGALILLKNANLTLQNLNDPSFAPIHELLNQDIAQLESTTPTDLNGLWLNVGEMMQEIQSLPTIGIRTPETMANSSFLKETEKTEETNKSSWKNSLAKSWQEMKELVKIQRHTKPIEPILSTEEQLLAHQHLSLMLEQIRWSILNQDETIYHHSIQDAQNFLNTYFETKEQIVQQFLNKLNTLNQVTLKTPIPNLDPLLRRFQEKGVG